MDKSKRKGKLKRRRLIILVLLIVFSGCVLISIVSFNKITAAPRHQAPILSDIEVGELVLIEARLLEYLSIGESTRAEVETFGNVHLAFTEYLCVSDDPSESCYRVSVPSWFCNDYHLQISFIFTDDLLSHIEYIYQGFECL